jgi:hypothetical protein
LIAPEQAPLARIDVRPDYRSMAGTAARRIILFGGEMGD